jgi:hypothetical protein
VAADASAGGLIAAATPAAVDAAPRRRRRLPAQCRSDNAGPIGARVIVPPPVGTNVAGDGVFSRAATGGTQVKL